MSVPIKYKCNLIIFCFSSHFQTKPHEFIRSVCRMYGNNHNSYFVCICTGELRLFTLSHYLFLSLLLLLVPRSKLSNIVYSLWESFYAFISYWIIIMFLLLLKIKIIIFGINQIRTDYNRGSDTFNYYDGFGWIMQLCASVCTNVCASIGIGW